VLGACGFIARTLLHWTQPHKRPGAPEPGLQCSAVAGGKWIRLSLPCAALALLLALPGAASAAPKHHPKRATESYVRDPEPPHALISVRGTNGYEIRISITQGSAFAFATGGFDSEPGPELDTSADYSISRARANAHRVRAKFGRVGLVSARFVPSGKVERFRDPNCKGGPEVTRRGAFVGTIRFEGEDDFTRFSAHRARGTITSTPRQICRLTKDVAIAERSDGPKHFLTSFFASAVSDDVSTYFVASVRELEPQVAEFEATRFEDRGNMFITREVEFEDAPAAGFVFDAGLDHATLAPPAPFAGNATFTRIDDFASRWEGPLTVSFPGAANVPLTGRAYAWGLDRSTDPSDFVEGMFP
jgi:hypothetical protein